MAIFEQYLFCVLHEANLSSFQQPMLASFLWMIETIRFQAGRVHVYSKITVYKFLYKQNIYTYMYKIKQSGVNCPYTLQYYHVQYFTDIYTK